MVIKNNIANDEKAQMMTIEAIMGAILIIAALLFVVSQAPSSIQQSHPHSETQLYHYGEDAIKLLKSNASNEHPDYDSLIQYYIGEKRFKELNSYLNNILPENVGYNLGIYDGRKEFFIIRNGYPTRKSITVNSLVATKGFPLYGIENLSGIYLTNKSFANGSLIIPMDDNQNNVITAYNLIMKISDMGIPVYQLLQDPRGETYKGYNHSDWSTILYTTNDPWNLNSTYINTDYKGGPYVINAADLTSIDINIIKNISKNPIEIPSSKIDNIEFSEVMSDKSSINLIFTLGDNSVRYVNLTIDDSNITSSSTSFASGNDSKFLDVDTTSVAFDDTDNSNIIGMVMFNKASYDIEVSNVTLTIPDVYLINVTIDGNVTEGASSGVDLNHYLKHNDTSRQVTVHKSAEKFYYHSTTWLTRSPAIAVYPKAGTMMNYYSDSGISFTLLDNNDILNGDLYHYDLLFIPHADINYINMPDNVVRNVIDWVSYGGTLLAECKSVTEIDQRILDVDGDNHSWNGFVGVLQSNSSNTIQFIGNNQPDNFGEYIYLIKRNGTGAYLHTLAHW